MFISCEEAKRLIKEQNAQFVDVRTPPEYEMSKLPGAINIPLQELEARVNELDKSRPIVVFCRSGSRSHMAQQMLQMMGFHDVHNMGPYTAWYQCPDV
ncbi:rhodanese-like domain-containing protein [Sulfurivirga sp.]|uniref:rhodanese-like domain-containing protein n=1 Tax=Sulfurivirga sp. TaxID=2614236 RepID=UPI0025FE970A|nr:rhodanese-like domain-containing protein [Sulfurivirga sp.]